MWKKQIFGLTCYSICLCAADPAKTPSSYSVSSPNAKQITLSSPTKNEAKNPVQEVEETEEEESDCLPNPRSFRLSVKHREAKGIGYTDGYTSLDGFFAFTSIDQFHPFFDVRLHIFNDGHQAANAGVGVRYQPSTLHTVFGLNGFFDFRRLSHSTFEQLGFGIEALSPKWEFRTNAYFPIINRDNLYSVSFDQFSGNRALFNVKRDFAFKGMDTSLGRTLYRKEFYSLEAIAGGYLFFAKQDQSAKGGLLKLRSNISRFLSLEVQGSYDSLFKGIFQGQAAVNVPFGKKIKARKKGLKCSQSVALADRLAEEVDRFEIIVCNSQKTQTYAQNPTTGEDLYFVFVNNTKSGGNGTAEAPFSTLTQAQNASLANQVIYVYRGNGTTTGQDVGITLKDGQWLQGSGLTMAVLTPYGADTIPAQTSLWPTLGTTSGDMISLANGNRISGFNIISSNNSSISGSNITDLILDTNYLVQANLYDIFLNGVSGNISILNNFSGSNNGLFLNTANDVNLVIEKNRFANSGNQNMNIQLKGNSNSDIAIGYNLFQNSISGSFLSTQNTASLNLSVFHNEFLSIQDTASYALQVKSFGDSNVNALFSENSFSSAATTGLSLYTSGNATTQYYVTDNSGSYTGSLSPAYPFTFLVDSKGNSNLLLIDNTANADGYLLTNNSPLATFEVQSPTLNLQGVESINSGSFTTSGSGKISYVSFNPEEIPATP